MALATLTMPLLITGSCARQRDALVEAAVTYATGLTDDDPVPWSMKKRRPITAPG